MGTIPLIRGQWLLKNRKPGTPISTEDLKAMKHAFIENVDKMILKLQALNSTKNLN